ncbi:uncharacterized protein LOC114396161 isoform X2 [Glycine soja]|uniref:uncharacterized protein LOC114396161 isoform X2 n=1 Tax=Glycine soja TaxID=3848 RepID=UPI00103CE014|nr:uncharacterized protein LOC114396161 isoform X2 [Glycine soja]
MAAITATTRRTKTPPSPKAFEHVSFCGVVCGIHPHIFSFQFAFAFAFHLAFCFFQEASFGHRWPRSMKLLPETPRTARRSSKPSALNATPSTKVPTTNKVRELLCIDVEGNIMLVEVGNSVKSEAYFYVELVFGNFKLFTLACSSNHCGVSPLVMLCGLCIRD